MFPVGIQRLRHSPLRPREASVRLKEFCRRTATHPPPVELLRFEELCPHTPTHRCRCHERSVLVLMAGRVALLVAAAEMTRRAERAGTVMVTGKGVTRVAERVD